MDSKGSKGKGSKDGKGSKGGKGMDMDMMEIDIMDSAPSFMMATGRQHTCEMYHHSVKCWGRNDAGQLGRCHTDDLYEPPMNAIDFGADFVPADLECGGDHCCTVSYDRKVKCWGKSDRGQLGVGDCEIEAGEIKEVDLGS